MEKWGASVLDIDTKLGEKYLAVTLSYYNGKAKDSTLKLLNQTDISGLDLVIMTFDNG